MTWLGAIFGGTYQRRIWVAIACSIALHEIFAAVVPALIPAPSNTQEVVEHVTIARITKPTPSPKPKPTPIIPRRISFNQNEGKQAPKMVIKRAGLNKPKPPRTIHTKPIWDIVPVKSGQGAGAGLNNGAGSLGNGGTGSGTGTEGNGEGAGPCGAVDFVANGQAQFNPETQMYERNNIDAIIHYADGSAQTVRLDWTWRWKSEDTDPFNMSPDTPVPFQFPPPSQRSSEPAEVQYIMQYTRANGHSKLNYECPNIPPVPTPHP